MRLWKHWNEILLRFFYSLLRPPQVPPASQRRGSRKRCYARENGRFRARSTSTGCPGAGLLAAAARLAGGGRRSE